MPFFFFVSCIVLFFALSGSILLRDLKLPEVMALQKQLKVIYAMHNLKAAEEQVYRESWGIKAACGFVKRKGKRSEVTREACLDRMAHVHTKDTRMHVLILIYFPHLKDWQHGYRKRRVVIGVGGCYCGIYGVQRR